MFNNMLKKLYEFYNLKNVIFIGSILFLIFSAYFMRTISQKDSWNLLSDYPEEDFALLEAEANEIITSGNFKTPYNLKITSYNNKTNILTMTLEKNNSDISVTVKNYGTPTQEIDIERNITSNKHYFVSNVLFILVTSLLSTLISLLCVLVLIAIFLLFITILSKLKFLRKY